MCVCVDSGERERERKREKERKKKRQKRPPLFNPAPIPSPDISIFQPCTSPKTTQHSPTTPYLIGFLIHHILIHFRRTKVLFGSSVSFEGLQRSLAFRSLARLRKGVCVRHPECAWVARAIRKYSSRTVCKIMVLFFVCVCVIGIGPVHHEIYGLFEKK